MGSALFIGSEGCTSLSHLPRIDTSIKAETAGFISQEPSPEKLAQLAHDKRLEVHQALMSTLRDNQLFLPEDVSEKIDDECSKPIHTCNKLAEIMENRAKLDFFNYEDDCFTLDATRFRTKCPDQLLRENQKLFSEVMGLYTVCDEKMHKCVEAKTHVYRHGQDPKIDFNRFKPKEKIHIDG